MGMSEISTWVLIRRYDRLVETETAKLQSSLHQLNLTSGTVFEELRAIIFRLIAIEDDGSRVLKIRRHDNNLIPISTLLNGSERDNGTWIDNCSATRASLPLRDASATLLRFLNVTSGFRPFIIDIVGVHQFCPVERRTILPGYIDALKTKFGDLETRVLLAERALPEITTAHIQAVEEATSQLANCVSFLDRRLDELAPSDWRTQIRSGI